MEHPMVTNMDCAMEGTQPMGSTMPRPHGTFTQVAGPCMGSTMTHAHSSWGRLWNRSWHVYTAHGTAHSQFDRLCNARNTAHEVAHSAAHGIISVPWDEQWSSPGTVPWYVYRVHGKAHGADHGIVRTMHVYTAHETDHGTDHAIFTVPWYGQRLSPRTVLWHVYTVHGTSHGKNNIPCTQLMAMPMARLMALGHAIRQLISTPMGRLACHRSAHGTTYALCHTWYKTHWSDHGRLIVCVHSPWESPLAVPWDVRYIVGQAIGRPMTLPMGRLNVYGAAHETSNEEMYGLSHRTPQCLWALP